MNTDAAIDIFWAKAQENLASAASELANRRYNAGVTRCYYACFQAAIVALLRAGIRPVAGGLWGHGFVQAQFAGQLIARRKLYPAAARDSLPRLLELREKADYEAALVGQTQAVRALSRAEAFLDAVMKGGE
jgi:uncharacterized protein (UPF0332 family)